MIPIADDNRARRGFAWMTWLIIVANALVFIFVQGFGADAEDIALAVQEALKNIIQHACPADNNMHFECIAKPEQLLIDITDTGLGFDTSAVDADPVPPMALHGRGVQLIRGLMDNVWITSDQEGTVVHMEKKKRPAG